jgi:hypothetical protein
LIKPDGGLEEAVVGKGVAWLGARQQNLLRNPVRPTQRPKDVGQCGERSLRLDGRTLGFGP